MLYYLIFLFLLLFALVISSQYIGFRTIVNVQRITVGNYNNFLFLLYKKGITFTYFDIRRYYQISFSLINCLAFIEFLAKLYIDAITIFVYPLLYLLVKSFQFLVFFSLDAYYEWVFIDNIIIDVNWVIMNEYEITLDISTDCFSFILVILVFIIYCLVYLYSIEYMKNEPFKVLFFFYLTLFAFFMFLLIMANDLIILFFGWEGVGLCSYLLINFWTDRVQANKAALKAVVINKFGDVSVFTSIILIATIFETTNISIFHDMLTIFLVFQETQYYFVIAFCFLFGAMGKSAQFGLHIWLPQAMEGPTPVSALIHSATMVTAGVILLIKTSFIYIVVDNLNICMIIVGCLTALFAGFVASVQHDLKKIIAYSTCSQLGYMIMVCGTIQYFVSFYHLLTHAFFKALLFLAAGILIHTFKNEQDIRKLLFTRIETSLPFVSIFIIGNFALIGLPGLSGYYSKDLILEFLYLHTTMPSFFLLAKIDILFYYLALSTTFLTVIYTTRVLYFLFCNPEAYYTIMQQNINLKGLKITPFMYFSLIILAIGSLFSGYLIFMNMKIITLPLYVLSIDETLSVAGRILLLHMCSVLSDNFLYIKFFSNKYAGLQLQEILGEESFSSLCYLGYGNDNKANFLFEVNFFDSLTFFDCEYLPLYIKILPVLFSVILSFFFFYSFAFFYFDSSIFFLIYQKGSFNIGIRQDSSLNLLFLRKFLWQEEKILYTNNFSLHIVKFVHQLRIFMEKRLVKNDKRILPRFRNILIAIILKKLGWKRFYWLFNQYFEYLSVFFMQKILMIREVVNFNMVAKKIYIVAAKLGIIYSISNFENGPYAPYFIRQFLAYLYHVILLRLYYFLLFLIYIIIDEIRLSMSDSTDVPFKMVLKDYCNSIKKVILLRKYLVFYKIFSYGGYFDFIYNYWISHALLFYGLAIFKCIDKGCLEFFGPFGIESLYSKFAKRTFKYQLFSIDNLLIIFFFCLSFLVIFSSFL